MAKMNNDNGALTLVLFFAVILAILLIPTMVAFSRKHPNRWAIFLVNFVTGSTGIGWFACLIWALRAAHISPEDGVLSGGGGESGLNWT